MARCFICGKKLGLMNAKTMTSDAEFLCLDDTNKLFGENTGREHIGVKPTYSTWVQKHTSTEIKKLLSENRTAILEGPDRCIGCGKKLGLFNLIKTKDNKGVCKDCISKVFGNCDGVVIPWISNHSSDYFLAYLRNSRTLKAISENEAEGETLFCPYCNSENVQPLSRHHKAFSVGKAAAGVAIAGGVGLAAGLLGKNTKQTDFVCMDCGKQFKR